MTFPDLVMPPARPPALKPLAAHRSEIPPPQYRLSGHPLSAPCHIRPMELDLIQ